MERVKLGVRSQVRELIKKVRGLDIVTLKEVVEDLNKLFPEGPPNEIRSLVYEEGVNELVLSLLGLPVWGVDRKQNLKTQIYQTIS